MGAFRAGRGLCTTCTQPVHRRSAAWAFLGGFALAGCVADGVSQGHAVTAPGVLRAHGGDQTLVVMWVDDGFRTAAVGDAAGTWAAVIDRARPGGADRVKAATEILDFNGWDVSQIQSVEG